MKTQLIKINEAYFNEEIRIADDLFLSIIINDNNSAKLTITVEENANVVVKILDMSGTDFRCHTKLDGSNINFSINSFAVVSKHRKSDIQIEVPADSKNCVASECEEAFLLNDQARNNATLSVLANEKESAISHSYSCNHISAKQLDFLMARGLKKSEAKQLILNAKIDKFLLADFIDSE